MRKISSRKLVQYFPTLQHIFFCTHFPCSLNTAEKYVLPRLLRIAFPVTKNPVTGENQPSPMCIPSEYLVKAIPGFVHLARAFPHFGPQILNAFDGMKRNVLSKLISSKG